MSRIAGKISIILALTYCLTAIFFLVLQLNGGNSNQWTNSLLGIPMCFPIISIWFVQKVCYKKSLLQLLGLKWKFNWWFIIASVIPLVMALLLNEFSIFVNHISLFTVNSIAFAFLIGISISAVSALLEEVAWRGFFYSELQGIGKVKSALIIGCMWATFHIPVTIMYVYPHNRIDGAVINFVQMFCLSLILSILREKSRNVFAPTLFHGLLNTMVLTASMDSFKLVCVKIILSVLTVLILSTSTRLHKSMTNGKTNLFI